MKRNKYSKVIIFNFLFTCLIGNQISAQAKLPFEELNIKQLEAHIRFLASDELMGRKPGTCGADIAARYIAEQFRVSGLKTFPGTDDYFQHAPLSIKNKETKEEDVINSKNVIGFLEGNDPELKDEFVLLCAHYDHLGTKAASGITNEDTIYNGARDNAMGVTALLSAGRVFASQAASRSMIFIAFTGEEEGMLGSKFFVEHPLILLNKIIYVLNNDGGGFNDTTLIRIAGLGRTTASNLICNAADSQNLKCLPYPEDYKYLYDLSDNAPFAALGIQAVTVSPGFDKIDDEILKYIHTVKDEADNNFNYSYLLKFTRAYIAIAGKIANADFKFRE